jgi:hypothetical protein
VKNKGFLNILCILGVTVGSMLNAEPLPNLLSTALKDTKVRGFLDTSAIYDFGNGSGDLPGRTFDVANRQDGFNLNVFALTLDGSSEQNGWTTGFLTDLLFGPDANLYGTNSTGNKDSDFAIKQAYIHVDKDDLTIKLGVFDTIIGYEVFAAKDNRNYSRSYAYFIEPFAQTGVLASYAVNDVVQITGAVANSWNTIINARPTLEDGRVTEDRKTYLGGIGLVAPEDLPVFGGANLYTSMSYGFDSNESADQIKSYYTGGSWPLMEALSLGFALDYRELDPAGEGPKQNAKTAATYASIQACEDLSFHGRAEWARGTAGSWGVANIGTPEDDHFFGLTFTTQYDWLENLLTRLEMRWDKDLSDGIGSFNNPPSTGTDPDKDNLSLALNAVFSF